jgi:hypothetical protein
MEWLPILAFVADLIERQPDTSVRVQLDAIDREYRQPPESSKLLAGTSLLPRPDANSVYTQCLSTEVVGEPHCAAEAFELSEHMPTRKKRKSGRRK